MNETSRIHGVPLILRSGEVFGSKHYQHSLGGFRIMESRYEPGSELPEHRHEVGNLCLVLAGAFQETFDTASRRCGPARLLYRSPREVHAQRFGSDGALCLTIEPPAGWSLGTEPRDGAVDLNGLPGLVALRLCAELRGNPDPGAAILEVLTGELISMVSHRLALGRRQLPGWLLEVRRILELRYTGTVRSRELAREVGVHPVHLARSFGRVYRYRLADHVRHLRVHAACEAMLSGKRSLSRIAADLGFSDHSHLTRAFRSTLGMTPRWFRSMMAGR